MKIKLTALMAAFIGLTAMNAQQFLTPTYSHSGKKTSYITMSDGSELQGTIKDIDREKGLIEYIKIEDGAGKKHKLDAEEIQYMYLPPSGADKLAQKTAFLTDAQKWNNDKLNQDFLSQGYVYYVLTDVKIKKKESKLLMQLLNPDFSKEVQVYFDPFAKQTASVGVGSVNVVGGNAKSYYVSKGGAPAVKLEKKAYKEEFIPLWKSCDAVMEKYPDASWSDLAQHVLTYSECQE